MRCADARAILALGVVAALLFTLAPQLDIWVSSRFYVLQDGFPLENNGLLVTIRAGLRWTNLAVALFAMAMLALSAVHPAPLGRPARLWGGIAALYLIGPGLLVNMGLKEYWGRARPADIAEFGGGATFTPPLELTDQCVTNCSFVSGEASGATATAVALVWLARGTGPDVRGAAAVLAVLYAVTGSALRVVKGRHFLSDVVFAILLVLLVAAAIDCLMRRAGQRAKRQD